MLSAPDNEYITRIGPGTPMGNLMRQYWVPAMLSFELPEPNCTPLRVMLLGEQLIAFRDSNGRVGLLQNSCPHRGASLFFGRNEDCGLRCVYHGWKFDVEGNCVDMPNEPAESSFKHKVQAVAYACVERAGIVWAYLGERHPAPPLPDFEACSLPEDDCRVSVIQRQCSWLQALEGDTDTCHIGFLHGGHRKLENAKPGTFAYYALRDRAPKYAVVDTDYGSMYGAYREAQPGHLYWRIAQFLLPFYTMPPQNVLGLRTGVRAWVPMDDTHTLVFTISVRGSQNFQTAPGPLNTLGMGSAMLPNESGWFGRFRLVPDVSNDYLIDRDKQRNGQEYTGITGINLQDQAITESMGPIFDRSTEHLGTSDTMIIRVRRRLIAAARALEQEGTLPPGVDTPAAYRVRAGGVILPKDADWVEATRELREAYLEHPEIDVAVAG